MHTDSMHFESVYFLLQLFCTHIAQLILFSYESICGFLQVLLQSLQGIIAYHHLAAMLITVLAVLYLTITTTTVSGVCSDCECEYNLAQNDLFGNQRCFTVLHQIRQNWVNYTFDDDAAYRDTLCYGNCGTALNRVLHYQDRAFPSNREVSINIQHCYLYVVHIDIYLNMQSVISIPPLYQLAADYYCVKENSCPELTEDLVNGIVNNFSQVASYATTQL